MQRTNLQNIAFDTLYAASADMRAAKKANREVLAANVRALMSRRRWSQKQLGAKSGVSQTQIGNILRQQNDTSTGIITAIANAFGLPDWLLLVPNLAPDLLDSPELPAIIERYTSFRNTDPYRTR